MGRDGRGTGTSSVCTGGSGPPAVRTTAPQWSGQSGAAGRRHKEPDPASSPWADTPGLALGRKGSTSPVSRPGHQLAPFPLSVGRFPPPPARTCSPTHTVSPEESSVGLGVSAPLKVEPCWRGVGPRRHCPLVRCGCGLRQPGFRPPLPRVTCTGCVLLQLALGSLVFAHFTL